MIDFGLTILFAVAAYCLVQIVKDFRRKNYVMAVIGAACLVGLLNFPIVTHAVALPPFTAGAH